eukprot:12920404-Alexandrium_andersonii.AAC.1
MCIRDRTLSHLELDQLVHAHVDMHLLEVPFLGRPNGLLAGLRQLGPAPLHRACPPSLLFSE